MEEGAATPAKADGCDVVVKPAENRSKEAQSSATERLYLDDEEEDVMV